MEWEQYEGEGEEEEGRRRDTKIDQAKAEIVAMLEANPETVYYIKQVQVLFEKEFFHWITGRAVGELIAEGTVGHEDVPLRHGKARFVFNTGHRYRVREIERAVSAIEAYSDSEMARACGHWAENTFLVALMERGFGLEGRNSNEYKGRKWTETKHNLDFIVQRDSLVYGAEVKNTWDYIPGEEFRLKMKMCAFLGIRPLFIWRYAPKTYMFELIEQGGYGMIFKAHIFPLGHMGLVTEIREALGLECDSPARIPDGILDRFMKFHSRVAGV